ncbi:hypothetical protein CsSME_00016324 [Camellia sinensis var. sinensis]
MEKADPSQRLYTRMRLWEFLDQYVIEATDVSAGSCLAISRMIFHNATLFEHRKFGPSLV